MSDWIYKNRVIPRAILFAYMITLAITLKWYWDFPIEYQTNINPAVMSLLIENGKDAELAASIATTKVQAIGRPTGYTILLSSMFAAAPFIFGVYVNGRVENGTLRDHSTNSDDPPRGG